MDNQPAVSKHHSILYKNDKRYAKVTLTSSAHTVLYHVHTTVKICVLKKGCSINQLIVTANGIDVSQCKQCDQSQRVVCILLEKKEALLSSYQ